MRALIVLGAFFAVIIGVCWLVLPRVAEQLVALVNGFPELVTRASQSLSDALENYPDLQRAVQLNGSTMGSLAPDAVKFLVGIGGASFKLLGAVAALIIFFASIIYLPLLFAVLMIDKR